MNRRELLKAMVSMPIVTAMGCSTFSSKPTSASTSFTTMNLVFEGPFIFFMDNPQVRVFAPKVDGHRYLINNADAAESTYMLSGVAGAGDVQKTQYELPQGADAFRLSASQLHLTLNSQKSPFFTFVLPAPDRVVALSARQAEIIDAFGNRRSAVMPTSYAFVYRVADSAALSLVPNTGWKPQSGAASPGFANLVVAAGLPLSAQDPTGQHTHAAFAELKSYLPALSMELLSTGAETQSGTVEGLPSGSHSGLSRSQNAEKARVVPAVLRPATPAPRLLRASAIMDCDVGGVIVTKP
jgi:hypothetical protein